jgi:hypothetical protein
VEEKRPKKLLDQVRTEQAVRFSAYKRLLRSLRTGGPMPGENRNRLLRCKADHLPRWSRLCGRLSVFHITLLDQAKQ